MGTSSRQNAAEAARSFRLAARLRESDPLAYDLALYRHFGEYVPVPDRQRTCSLPDQR